MPENPVPIATQFANLLDYFTRMLPGIVTALIVLLVTFVLASWLRRLVRRGLERRKADMEAVLLVEGMVYWSVWILGIVVALQRIGVNLTALVAGLGVVGLTIGFALQDVSKNFIAGILLLIQRPFQIGNVIEVVGYTGSVRNVSLRATEMITLDGRLVYIPNADVYTNPITNFSQPDRRRVDIALSVGKNSDLDAVRQAGLAAVQGLSGLLLEPPPALFFQLMGANSVDLTLFYWIDTRQTDPLTAKDAGLVALKSTLDRAGIEIPYPTQVQVSA